MNHAGPESNTARKQATTGLRRRSIRVAAGVVGLAATGALVLGVGSASSAEAARADTHGCVVASNGFTYNCETGILSWDNTVTISDPNDKAVLYDAATKPQKVVAGPVHLSHGPGPGSIRLGTFKCGPFQFDVQAPGPDFLAGHKGTNGPCTVPSTTTTTTTAPPAVTTTTTTTAPPAVTTTTTTAPPATHTRTRTAAPAATTPPASSTSTSSVMATTYSVAPVAAGATSEDGAGSGLTLGQWLLALLGLVALWVALGRPSPRIQRTPGRHELR